jgi:hypothetical protein
MKSQEILRYRLPHEGPADPCAPVMSSTEHLSALMLREIAYQLALMNEAAASKSLVALVKDVLAEKNAVADWQQQTKERAECAPAWLRFTAAMNRLVGYMEGEARARS